jgi:hypothetical protein
MKRNLIAACVLSAALAGACNEYEDPPPPPLATLPDPPATQYQINGRWDGKTDQGRPLRFDVEVNASVVETTLSLHHDCTGGQLVLKLGGYDSRVNADSFSGTVIWRRDEPGGKFYVGTLTVSGTFTGDRMASGAFINSITEKQADNLGVCGPTSGTWEATKSE